MVDLTEWQKANGEPCSRCRAKVLRFFGPLKQCKNCYLKENETVLEEIECPKCSIVAVLVTKLSHGAATASIICRNCGTFSK